MSELGEGQKPGTYTGADGREYRWRKFGPDVVLESMTDVSSVIPVALAAADIDAAKAALDALVKAESEGWVELAGGFYRISLDGKRVQQQYNHVARGQAYRKGREVGQQESADLRDAARELVRMAKIAAYYRREEWLLDAAKALEEKL